MPRPALTQSQIPGHAARKGKVRDIYDFGDCLLFVATDRISAFDWVLPTGIPDKGRVLTQMSLFWFARLSVPNHLLASVEDEGLAIENPDCAKMQGIDEILRLMGADRDDLAGAMALGSLAGMSAGLQFMGESPLTELAGRSLVVRKTQVFPVECVVRGYLAGSGWKEYQQTQSVCGIKLPAGLQESSQLPEPIFTPATKAESGHDENISFERMSEIVGADDARALRQLSLQIYREASEYAQSKGIISADTKFEFGRVDGEILLIDEVLTPDSSRFWPADRYQ
ncbi:MAG TPA: phosphoribosylaminoimidazolesuccinocarboxamide synthase, partial [Planctomycetaceae bacterium]|nr:phosphoribosylaminoimidazolesuccinocarboxamide synthase [Planctomycetaceae bacterium]